MTFEEFFRRATGATPYGYQTRLAQEGLPPVLKVPTGCGKTAIVLAWLWRRRHGPEPGATPRRLVFALPQRSLVEQVARQVTDWLSELGVHGEVALHVVMGGQGESQRRWRLDLHRPAIVVGTVDSLVSKALNRGYGISRAIYPIDFALVTNGAHWVLDEIQLAPESTSTMRQLAAFVAQYGPAEPFGLTCMSATVPEDLLDTVDNPAPAEHEVARIAKEDRTGELARRLDARRTVARLAAEPGNAGEIAAAVRQRHRPGHLTLVVLNTVRTARAVAEALRKHGGTDGSAPDLVLVHSRFRGVDRERLAAQVSAPWGEAGRIVVATQVVEAGLDLDAAVLVTEAAPWPAVVQRAGRCNRAGRLPDRDQGLPDAQLWWLPPAKAAPYPEADVAATVEELTALEGAAPTGEELGEHDVDVTRDEVAVLRRSELVALFDTSPDLNGADIDVAPYVRDADDSDVQLAWATWTEQGQDGATPPPRTAKPPPQMWRCRAPLGDVMALVRRAPVWRFDQVRGQWSRVGTAASSTSPPPRPGEMLVVAATVGGYDPHSGFDPTLKQPVPECPSLDSEPDPAAGAEDAYGQDDGSVAQQQWLSLSRHSEDVRQQARALLDAIRPGVSPGTAEAVVTAAHLHDVGKAHPIWQTALCACAPDSDEERPPIEAGGPPWAKSPGRGRLRFTTVASPAPQAAQAVQGDAGRGGDEVAFRHELASLLLVDGPLRARLAELDDPDLARYLILAHHGKLRVQVREPQEATGARDGRTLLGLRDGERWPVTDLLGHSGEVVVDLAPFRLGGDESWSRTALALRDRYGPFVLAYLEAVVRAADWRASADERLPTTTAVGASEIPSERKGSS